jgi:hypothetical protein
MKTGQNWFHEVTYLPSTIGNLELTAIHNYSSMPVDMDGCEDVWFK